MKALNALKLRIMVWAFRIRTAAGEAFEDIAADYPSLTTDDLEAIKAEKVNQLKLGDLSWRYELTPTNKSDTFISDVPASQDGITR